MHVQGWICNSSICMTRRGMKPTGIAIFEAQQKGFPSVAHFVQVQRCPLVLAIPTCPTSTSLLHASDVPAKRLLRQGTTHCCEYCCCMTCMEGLMGPPELVYGL